MQNPQYFLDKADECMRLVRTARETADRLEGMAHDFMARAVEIETARERTEKQAGTAK